MESVKGVGVDIQQYMSAVPEFDRFLTVDELNEDFRRIASEYPEIARLERVGSSQLGEPIDMLSLGTGDRNILLFACPHPNEPIGAMMVHHLARVLAEDPALRDGLGFTWNLIACVDPDGTRLNEGWFAGPFTIANYAENFYRPAGFQQVEWTFPTNYKTNYFDQSLRETQMLMRVIDRLQPVLMGSLHNAGFGGVYYYISKDTPALYDTFHKIAAWEELPLRLGEPEVPYVQEFAPAIFGLISSVDTYDYLETNGADLSTYSQGGSSAEYAEKYGTLTLIIELPYFDDPRVNDQTVTSTSRREAILAGLDRTDAEYDALKAHFDAVKGKLRTHSAFEQAVGWFIEIQHQMRGAERHWAETSPETDRPATVAELFSNDQEGQGYRLLMLGMLRRMLRGEVATGNSAPVIREHLAQVEKEFAEWADRLESQLEMRAIPIRKLVSVQLGAIIAAAVELTEA